MPYQLFADLVLLAHFAVVIFVVGGLVFIVAGGLRGWEASRSFWFRGAHMAATAFVAAQAWFGAVCPLTTLEMGLRMKAREPAYAGSFIEHWLARLLYYEAPPWVFTLAYSAFAVAVLLAWWMFPARRRRGKTDGQA